MDEIGETPDLNKLVERTADDVASGGGGPDAMNRLTKLKQTQVKVMKEKQADDFRQTGYINRRTPSDPNE